MKFQRCNCLSSIHALFCMEHKLEINIVNFLESFAKEHDIYITSTYSYGDLLASFSEIISQGQYVAIKTTSSIDTLSSFFSCLLSGKTPVLIDPEIKNYKLMQILETIDLDLEYQRGEPIQNLTLNLDSQFIFFTSGSTGKPKAIVHTLRTLSSHLELFRRTFMPTSGEKYLINLPLHHVGGFMLLMRSFFHGGRILDQLDFGVYDLSYLSLVPAQVEKFLEEKLVMMLNLKALFIGGAKLDDRLKSKLDEYNIKYYETYGMTETLSFVALNGKCLPGISFKLNQESIIEINSPTLFEGSIENKVFVKRQGDFYTTSDIGTTNSQGDIVFLKRADRVINTGGVKVNLYQVEMMIHEKQVFEQFIVTSVPDLKWGEMLVVFYSQKEHIELSKIQWLKNNYDKAMIPKFFIPLDFSALKSMKLTMDLSLKYYLDYLFDYEFIDNQQQTTNIYFHGFMEDKKAFAFSHSPNCNHLYLSLPGHGKTKVENFYSLEDFRFKFSKFVELNFNQFHLIGYSMGGRIVLDLLTHSRLNPINVTLISSGLGLDSETEKQERLMSDLKLFGDDSLDVFFNKWYSQSLFGNFKDHPSYKNYVNEKLSHDKNEWIKSLEMFSQGAMGLRSDYIHTLKKYSDKIHYICGSEDKKYLSNCEFLKNFGIKISVIEGAFHNLHKTHPTLLKIEK